MEFHLPRPHAGLCTDRLWSALALLFLFDDTFYFILALFSLNKVLLVLTISSYEFLLHFRERVTQINVHFFRLCFGSCLQNLHVFYVI